MTNLLDFDPIKKFIDTVGKDIERYFGKGDACIIYLRPDGIFYGEALYEWLKARKKNIVLGTMEDDATDLDEELVRGRKVLIVDNDVVTGKGYKRSTEALRAKKRTLQIKGIKFATSYDRIGVADFSVAKYSAEAIWRFEELDGVDLKILQCLIENGRESLAEIGKRVNLSSVAVKNRVDKLLKDKAIRIGAGINVDQFYTMCAQIYIETDEATIEKLIEKFEKRQEVFLLVRVTGMYNLLVGVLGNRWHNIQEFIENDIRSNSSVKKIFISTGEVPIVPKAISPKF